MLLQVVRSNLKKVDIHGVMTLSSIFWQTHFNPSKTSLYVDIPGFISPCALTSDSLRPDLLLVIPGKCLYVLALTLGFETNVGNNSHRKQLKYKTLVGKQQKNFNKLRFVSLSMSALGVFHHLSEGFIDMLQDLNFDEATKKYVIRRTMAIVIGTSCYIFCRRNKDWDSPELLIL